MRKQAFQPGEIRDEQNNIIRPGAYGKNSAFATAAMMGFWIISLITLMRCMTH